MKPEFPLHPVEKEMATHSSILAWTIPWTEEPGGLLFIGSHRVGHNCSTLLVFINHFRALKIKENILIVF